MMSTPCTPWKNAVKSKFLYSKYLGFYAFSDKDENWLTIDDVQFYKASSDASDLGISSISKPFDYAQSRR